MISRYTYQGLTWVDLESPTREEILHISEEFNLPQLVGQEMFSSTLHSKVDLYDHFIYLILHFPVANKRNHEQTEQEIDFVIGKDFFLTVRYELIDSVHEFSKIFEVSSLLNRSHIVTHGGFIFMEMMKQFYKYSLRELEEITHTIRAIEHGIFSGEEGAMVKSISHTSRRLLDFKQAIRFHHDVLQSYESSSKRFFGEDYGYYASVITAEFNKVNTMLESNRDILKELQRTNDSLLSTKQNDITRTFTIMSFITFPLMLVSSVFAMRLPDHILLINNFAEFFFVLGAMVIIGCVMLLFFKVRKWL